GLTNPTYIEALRAKLDSIDDNHVFAAKLIKGTRSCEVEIGKPEGDTLVALEGTGETLYHLADPMPSIYFSRDSFAVIGNGVTINRMYWNNRNREPLFGEIIFKYHPEYSGSPILYSHDAPFHIEGGDILNINAKTLAIGLSQRTEAAAIDLLAQNIFWGNNDSQIETIWAFKIPSSYAFMHLDTVFTQVDYDKFTIYPGIVNTLKVYRITRGSKSGKVNIVEKDDTLENILKEVVGVPHVKLIECGGGDMALASREQWNDGSNTLAIAPGVAAVYERNEVTNDILYKEGIRLLVVPSAELSRGRGGPRCMTMPFWRDEI
ncbi:MAG: arginine deiminase, partial [Coriobacteriales bacterium]|nr:arginine deiminase [Coriobacteriales bacterium]